MGKRNHKKIKKLKKIKTTPQQKPSKYHKKQNRIKQNNNYNDFEEEEDEGEDYEFNDAEDLETYKDMMMTTEDDIEKLPHDPFTIVNIPITKQENDIYIKELIENHDIILEIIDARNPTETRIPHIEKWIISKPDKFLIIIMNRNDLVTQANSTKWKESISKQFDNKDKNTFVLSTSACIREEIDKLLDNIKNIIDIVTKNSMKSPNKKNKTVKIGVWGYPNMGKESWMYSFKLKEEADWIEKEIYYDEEKTFCIDSVYATVFDNDDSSNKYIISKATKSISNIVNPEQFVERLLAEVGIKCIEDTYGIQVNSRDELVEYIDRKFKYKNDFDKAWRHILRDVVNGKIKYETKV